jgi:hypothetical protein
MQLQLIGKVILIASFLVHPPFRLIALVHCLRGEYLAEG